MWWQNLESLSFIHQGDEFISAHIDGSYAAFYAIQSGNGAGLFLQPRSPHGAAATVNNLLNSRPNSLHWNRQRVVGYWLENKNSAIDKKIMTPIQASILSNCRIESNRKIDSPAWIESNRIFFNRIGRLYYSSHAQLQIVHSLLVVVILLKLKQHKRCAESFKMSTGNLPEICLAGFLDIL